MRISIITDWWAPEYVGGAEKTLEAMAIELVENGHTVQVVTFQNETRQNKSHVEKGIEVIRVKTLAKRRWDDKRNFSKIREGLRSYVDFISPLLILRKVKTLSPHIILFGEIDRFGASVVLSTSILLRNIPMIRSYHDFSDACVYRSKFRNNYNCEAICGICKIKNLSFKAVSNKYSASIYVSEFLYFNLSVSKRVSIDTQYIGYPNVLSNVKNPIHLTSENEPSKSTLFLGIVSRINVTKDIETVLRALNLTSRRVRLHIVGDGDRDYLDLLKDFQKRNNLDVIFCGFQENPYQYLKSLGVEAVIVPAIWQEAFGRVPVEAAINGFHAIVSATGGLVESGMQMQPPAVFYTPGNAENLASRLNVYEVPDHVAYVKPINSFNNAVNSALQKFVQVP